ncbi:FAD-dependent monooxygenase [Amycolatopsis antarctica]|uniref:FAD-dependent monooxygenase n=1 Tax=Amycolatopsis antarctica TaxID=1854586 RepID=UPI0013FD2E7D
MPFPDDRVYWFGTLNTSPGAVFSDEHGTVRVRFAGWHSPIRECIEATRADAVIRHDIYDLARPLDSFVRGRTLLLGDAAHAMTPNLGQGAGQGIEDAATLVLLLRDVSTSELDSVLARYNDLRRKRTATILQRSRMAGRVAQVANPLAAGLRNAALSLTPGRLMGAMSQRIHAWPKPTPQPAERGDPASAQLEAAETKRPGLTTIFATARRAFCGLQASCRPLGVGHCCGAGRARTGHGVALLVRLCPVTPALVRRR